MLANVEDDAQRCNLRIRYVIRGSVLAFMAVSIFEGDFQLPQDKYCGFIDYLMFENTKPAAIVLIASLIQPLSSIQMHVANFAILKRLM